MIINKKRNYKKIIIILVSIILLFLITIIIVKVSKTIKHQKFLKQEQQRVKQYTALTDFKDMQEVALYLNCNLIKQEDSQRENISYDIYMELPIKIGNNNAEGANLVENLIQFSSYVLKYKNFIIIDEKNNTTITVFCNEEHKVIENYYINNIENYYEAIKTKENVESYKEIETIELEVNSSELQQLIAKKWDSKSVEFGTLESTYRNYNVYFDEGIQTRNVAGKIFNIVFTNKYEQPIVNNLTTASTYEEIRETLGKPQFVQGDLIGYKGKNIYVFFYKNQVSVYRIDEFKTDKISEIIKNKLQDENNQKALVDEIKKEWKDYDIYDYDVDYVKLQYTLKGICIKYDSTNKKGIILYNNYNGKIYGDTTFEEIVSNKEDVPNGMMIENVDLVFKEELNRVSTLDDTTPGYNYTTSGVILNKSNMFKIYKKNVKGDTSKYKVRFISIGEQYPNSELRESIAMGMWYDDCNFIYSVSERGIFVYNAKERTYKTIIEGNDKYNIKEIKDNVLYYDESTVELNI